jgi:hypothetical protein
VSGFLIDWTKIFHSPVHYFGLMYILSRIRVPAAHFVKVEEKAHHEIAGHYICPYILNIIVRTDAGKTGILVQNIIDGESDLPIFLFEQLSCETCIPQGKLFVESICPSRIYVVIKIA